MKVLIGLVLLAAVVWLVRMVRPRDGKPGAAFLQRRGADTLSALLVTGAVALGAALVIGGIVDMWPLPQAPGPSG